jgi:hypothetical protein
MGPYLRVSIRNLKFDNISGEAKFFVFKRRSWVVSEMVGAFVTMKCLFFFPPFVHTHFLLFILGATALMKAQWGDYFTHQRGEDTTVLLFDLTCKVEFCYFSLHFQPGFLAVRGVTGDFFSFDIYLFLFVCVYILTIPKLRFALLSMFILPFFPFSNQLRWS